MDLNNKTDMQVASLEYTGTRVIVRENEEALIGAVLRGGTPVYERVKDIIKPEMFGNLSYGLVWNAIEKLNEQGMTIDTITIGDEIERANKLNEVGTGARQGRAVLTDLRQTGDPRGVESYAENVQDYYVKKMLEDWGKKIVVWSANGRRAKDIIRDVNKGFGQIVVYSSEAVEHVWDMKQAVSVAYDETGAASEGKLKIVKTGLMDLDRILNGGLYKTNLYVGAARPGQGKTGLMVTIALHNARREGKRVLIFSLEMSAVQLTHRFLSQITGIPVDCLISGRLKENEWPIYTNAVEELSTLPITVIDMAAMKIGNVRQLARQEMVKNPYDLLCFDYIQLGEPDSKGERRQVDVGQVSRGLKAIAKEMDVPVFAAAQLNRAMEQRADKRPVLSDLREAGDIENDADAVIFIYRPDQYEKDSDKQNAAELIVAKHRNGAVGTVDSIFRAPMTKFENAFSERFAPNE